jgi:hypothetical protein
MKRCLMIAGLILLSFLAVGCAVAGQPEPTALPPAPVETAPASPTATKETLPELPITPPAGPTVMEDGMTTDMETPETPIIGTGEVPPDLFELVLSDLLARTGGAREAVAVLKAEQVIWSDGSMGCAQPGMMYTQAMVDGYQVIFTLAGEEYDYHMSAAGVFVLCESFLPGPAAIGTPIE